MNNEPILKWVEVKSEKDLPVGEHLFEWESNRFGLVYEKLLPEELGSIKKYITVRYLSETTPPEGEVERLPTMEECRTYAGINCYRHSSTSICFTDVQLQELIKYAQGKIGA